MENKKSILKIFSIVVFGYALIAFSANINASQEVKIHLNLLRIRVPLSMEDSEMNEADNGSSLKNAS